MQYYSHSSFFRMTNTLTVAHRVSQSNVIKNIEDQRPWHIDYLGNFETKVGNNHLKNIFKKYQNHEVTSLHIPFFFQIHK